WQFRFSHFNEKARWALDWKGIAHVRRSLLPGFHVPRVLWMTGQKSLPVLVLDEETIHDSTRIIERLERVRPEPALYPADAADRPRAGRARRGPPRRRGSAPPAAGPSPPGPCRNPIPRPPPSPSAGAPRPAASTALSSPPSGW